MPRKELTPEVAKQLATLSASERLFELTIRRIKRGKHKGMLIAEWKEGERESDDILVDVLLQLTELLETNSLIDISIRVREGEPIFFQVRKKEVS